MDYSTPPKFTVFSKKKARLIGGFLAVFIPGMFFYYAFKSHFFHLNRAFSDIHMVTVNVVAADAATSYPLFALKEAEVCSYLLEKAQVSSAASVSSSVASENPTSAATQSEGNSSVVTATSSASASSVPEFELPKAVEPLVVAPQCVSPLKAPVGLEQLTANSTMTFELTINKAGRVYRADLMGSSGVAEIDKATAEQLIKSWQLDPCMKEENAIECKRTVRVRWEK